tara:strand:+ start:363 stop:1046 length:684 start_codon:yes stop_codon:yes gene_type:complete
MKDKTKKTSSGMYGESGHERLDDDAYMTIDTVVTARFLERESFVPPVWECAAGKGDMSSVIRDFGYGVACSDIKDYRIGAFDWNFIGAHLNPPQLDGLFPGTKLRSIITNPPYKDLDLFIDQAHEFIHDRGSGAKVAFLCRMDIDHAMKRRRFFTDSPFFVRKYLLTWRPKWFAPDNKKGKGPRHNFAWYVWEWKAHLSEIPPTIHYLYRLEKEPTPWLPNSQQALL